MTADVLPLAVAVALKAVFPEPRHDRALLLELCALCPEVVGVLGDDALVAVGVATGISRADFEAEFDVWSKAARDVFEDVAELSTVPPVPVAVTLVIVGDDELLYTPKLSVPPLAVTVTSVIDGDDDDEK